MHKNGVGSCRPSPTSHMQRQHVTMFLNLLFLIGFSFFISDWICISYFLIFNTGQRTCNTIGRYHSNLLGMTPSLRSKADSNPGSTDRFLHLYSLLEEAKELEKAAQSVMLAGGLRTTPSPENGRLANQAQFASCLACSCCS